MEDDDFEWDDAKAAQNLASHGVSFEAARLAFDDSFGVARDDRRQNYGEDRYMLLGMAQQPPARCRLHASQRASADNLGSFCRATGRTALL